MVRLVLESCCFDTFPSHCPILIRFLSSLFTNRLMFSLALMLASEAYFIYKFARLFVPSSRHQCMIVHARHLLYSVRLDFS